MSDVDPWLDGIPWTAFGGPDVAAALRSSRARIERALSELLGGYGLRAEDVLNEVVNVASYNGVVGVRAVSFYSICAHHLVPFFGMATVIYEPGPIITGLGKIVRLVRDVHARRLQIQELLVRDVAEDIMRVLRAKGVAVSTTAKHLCICSRGPLDDTAEAVATYAIGTLAGRSVHDLMSGLPVLSRFGQEGT